jgi:GMP synthase (glutamine-hydrolysing)
LLAKTALDANAAVRFGPEAWGVQFHPEFDVDVIRAYIDARRDRLIEEGLDPDHLLKHISDTPAGPHILQRFIAHVRGRR